MILMNPDFAAVFWRIDVGQVLTTQELAKYLKLTEVTIYKYAKEGKIPGRRIGSRWRFDKDQIDGVLKSKEEENTK
jgi:PTS system nitrogen regulatory IIA component